MQTIVGGRALVKRRAPRTRPQIARSSRRSSPIQPLAFVLLALAICSGCQSVEVVDQRPDFVPIEQLESAVWFGSFEGAEVSSSSAVLLGADILVTNAHVWWESTGETSTIPQRSKRNLCCPLSPTEVAGPRPPIYEHEFELVEIGSVGGLDEPEPYARPEDDWVVLRAESPSWDPSEVAVIHEPALKPGWSPEEGTPLLVVGFSSIFDETPQAEAVDFRSFLSNGPYLIAGTAVQFEAGPAIRYPVDWPKPGGHSGGGVYVWNAERDQVELIGVFNSWTRVPMVVTQTVRPLWLSAFEFDRQVPVTRAYLFYAPISQFWPHARRRAEDSLE